jgi:hypothetical protein
MSSMSSELTAADLDVERIGAERIVLAGRGHTIQSLGPAYNSRVREFLTGAQAYAREP